jgi:hypothetical protein
MEKVHVFSNEYDDKSLPDHVLGNVYREWSKNPCTTQDRQEMLRDNKQSQHKGDNTMQSLWWIQDWSGELFEPKIH